MLSKCCTQYISKSRRPSRCHRTGKCQSSSQFPGRAVLKNVQAIRQLYSSPMLARSCLKSCKLGFSITRTKNFQTSKLGLEKAEEIEIKFPTFTRSQRKQGNSRKTSSSASLTTLKSLTVWIITNCGKLLKRWEYQTILPVSRETYTWVKKQQIEPCMEQLMGLGLRKYDRAVCCHPICLAYRLSTSREMPDLMSYKMESR